MPPIKHALLGASKAHQWLNCTPSIWLEQGCPEPPASEAANEGTLAHAIAEERLRRLMEGKKPITSAKHKKHPLYHPAMDEYVDVYVNYIWDAYQEAKKRTPDALLLLEQRVDFSEYAPDGFGTADAILIADGIMDVFDFKFGKGVPVEATDNPQIRLYGLGALNEFSDLYDIKAVRMHIVQPRLDSITSETKKAAELSEWGEGYVKPRAKLAANGEGKPFAGEHCRWCRFRNMCRAHGMMQIEIAKHRFADPPTRVSEANRGTEMARSDMNAEARDTKWGGPQENTEENLPAALSNMEISEILSGVDGLVRWAKSVKDFALEQAVNHGEQYPGWKVVEGRANRKITDDKKAAAILMAEGFGTDEIMTLKGIGDLEALVGKNTLACVLDGIIIKPAGKPVLAPETDKRPAISSAENAKAVFGAVEGEM